MGSIVFQVQRRKKRNQLKEEKLVENVGERVSNRKSKSLGDLFSFSQLFVGKHFETFAHQVNDRRTSGMTHPLRLSIQYETDIALASIATSSIHG